MGEVSIVVTKNVLVEVFVRGHQSQKQIALRGMSADIKAHISNCTKENTKKLILGDSIPLIVSDNHAIWRKANKDSPEDFDDIFNLLSRRPDIPVKFICRIE